MKNTLTLKEWLEAGAVLFVIATGILVSGLDDERYERQAFLNCPHCSDITAND